MGISDLTGELMRLCINSISTENIEICFKIRKFVQIIYDCNFFIQQKKN